VATLDRKGAPAHLLADCLTESLPQPPFVSWSDTTDDKPVGLGRWQQQADAWRVTELTAVRFSDRKGDAVAVCLVGSSKPLDQEAEQFLALLGHVAGPLFRVLERAAQGRRLQDLKDKAPTWLKGRKLCFLLTVLAMPLAYPWHSRTSCPVVLEPIAHRLVAAPFEGVFDCSLVKPGDQVTAGQILGRMDGRELRGRLAACEADLTRAAKSRDVNLAGGKLGAAQIDRLEMDRLEHERDVFQRRLEQLDIRSPIDGIVVTGDLLSYESATLKIGQSLYEIAPLDRLSAELAVPEQDLEYVAKGAEIVIKLDAVPGATWESRVERIRPRGELRDNLQVFVADTVLMNPDDNLRPGMKGSATVVGPRAPGAWLLVRKPWYALRRFLGW
jgi:RND family efflux transporter MFP subunit